MPISLGTELIYTTISEGFYITNLCKIRDGTNKNVFHNITGLTLRHGHWLVGFLVENYSNNKNHY